MDIIGNKYMKRKKAGFTMAELLVASAIFMLFSGALFGLYRMGNKMYSAGTWRYMRQKQAELFFHTLKERIEQASSIVCINQGAKADEQIKEAKDNPSFIALNSGKVANAGGEDAFVAEFIVGKPCIIDADGKAASGLTLYHSLYIAKSKNANAKVVTGDLCLNVQNNADVGNGNFKKDSWPPDTSIFAGSGAKFDANPNDYSLGPVPHIFKLEDVVSVQVQLEKYSEAKTDYSGAITFTVTMKNPKQDFAELKMTCSAKIDKSVDLEGRDSI